MLFWKIKAFITHFIKYFLFDGFEGFDHAYLFKPEVHYPVDQNGKENRHNKGRSKGPPGKSSSEHDIVGLDNAEHKGMEPYAKQKTDARSHKRKNHVFAEDVIRNFPVIKTKDFYGCDFSDSLRYIDVRKVI